MYKSVASPNASYLLHSKLWAKNRAMCEGEAAVKRLDEQVNIDNLLIPFSPSMSLDQYLFYKAEAELPGVTSEFAKMLVGGLLRKQPVLELPASVPEEATDWLLNNFGRDDSSLVSFMDEVLWEEIQTSRAWIMVDYPSISEAQFENLSPEEQAKLKPYPITHKAESVINWKTEVTWEGKTKLTMVIIRSLVEKVSVDDEFHPVLVDTVWVHDLAPNYRIRKYESQMPSNETPDVHKDRIKPAKDDAPRYTLVETIDSIKAFGMPLDSIPAWPLNGSIPIMPPMLTPIVDKEVSLYNKMSRRNHLLYGAATYTPIIMSDMADEEFENIVDSGLGSWIRLRQGDTADILKTPTEALGNMDVTIKATIDELARLGVRMLSPENEQSGVALEIRNAAQTAKLGTLNNKISSTMKAVFSFMIFWRYNIQVPPCDIHFILSADFDPVPLGADWLRLATEWYEKGLIPRSIWLQLLKSNDMIDPAYDDKEGQLEINADQMIITPVQQNDQYLQGMQQQQEQGF
jgi:hypothetical protein